MNAPQTKAKIIQVIVVEINGFQQLFTTDGQLIITIDNNKQPEQPKD